jgi:epoxyqueuosine reductase
MTAGDAIRTRALELGFEAAGIATVPPRDAPARFEAWLAAGMHGDMTWLATERHRERRADPLRVLPGLGSAICVALCHERGRDPGRDARIGRIARYAAGEDYHAIMRDRLSALQAYVVEQIPGARAIWYSDTGAILERGWAQQAGIGWIGKHSGLLSPRIGSWFLLGEVLVDRSLDPDPPFAADRCGTCARCITACPTNAIVAPHRVDARLCISYLTIELRGPIPLELRPLIGDWIFGCDICQEVCPWNRFAPPAREARLHARSLEGWTLERFLDLDEAAFRALFDASPIRRARRSGFLRNVCVALGNRHDASALPRLARALRDDPDALVRGHAAWAIGEIVAALDSDAAVEGFRFERSTVATRARVTGALSLAAGSDASPEVCNEAALALARVSARSPTGRTP